MATSCHFNRASAAGLRSNTHIVPALSFSARRPRATVQLAAAKISAPQGVTLPPQIPLIVQNKSASMSQNGFVDNAERLNSRAAMVGFAALLLVESIGGKGLLELLGISVGRGI